MGCLRTAALIKVLPAAAAAFGQSQRRRADARDREIWTLIIYGDIPQVGCEFTNIIQASDNGTTVLGGRPPCISSR